MIRNHFLCTWSVLVVVLGTVNAKEVVHRPGGRKAFVMPASAVKKLVIHYARSSDYSNDEDTVRGIWRTHYLGGKRKDGSEKPPWYGFGYHFGVGRNGVVYELRSRKLQGAHAPGRNEESFGIVLFGIKKFDENQIFLFVQTAAWLVVEYNLDVKEGVTRKIIQPHHGTCPGNGVDFDKLIKLIDLEVKDRRASGKNISPDFKIAPRPGLAVK